MPDLGKIRAEVPCGLWRVAAAAGRVVVLRPAHGARPRHPLAEVEARKHGKSLR